MLGLGIAGWHLKLCVILRSGADFVESIVEVLHVSVVWLIQVDTVRWWIL